jgi:hypothetical protein
MKTKIMLISFIIVSIAILAIACSKSGGSGGYGGGGNGGGNGGGGGGGTTCDTTLVKYSVDIVTILQANCYSCHGSGSTSGSGGIDLSTYTKLQVYANNGYLVGNVTHAPGYIGMPYQQPKMSDCNVNKIVAWVHQGEQNN